MLSADQQDRYPADGDLVPPGFKPAQERPALRAQRHRFSESMVISKQPGIGGVVSWHQR